MKRKIIIFIIALIVFSVESTAQKLSISPYSKYGVGSFVFQGNGQQTSMGQTGIASNSPFHVSKLNPASLSTIMPNNIIFEIGLFHKMSDFQSSNQTQRNNVSNFKHIMTGFRVTKWWQAGFGIVPYSGIGYKLIFKDSLSQSNFTQNYINDYEGSGGINQVFISNSFKIYKNLSLGATVNYNFGEINKINTTTIADKKYTSITVHDSRNIIKTFSFNFGVLYADSIKKDAHRDILTYSLGAIYSNKITFSSPQTKFVSRAVSAYNNNFSDSIFFDTISTVQASIPHSWGVGLAFCLYDQLSLNIDYRMQDWSQTQFLGEQNFMKNQFIGVGVEYVREAISKKFYKTIRYRLGGFEEKTYVQHNSQHITTHALTAGIGIPVKTVQLNFGVVAGRTGNNNAGLTEKFYEFNLGISLYDIWFIKRKFM